MPPKLVGISHDRKLKSYDVERAFYEFYASKLDYQTTRVPRMITTEKSMPGQVLLLLEDLDEAEIRFPERRN